MTAFLLSGTPLVRAQSGVPEAPLQALFRGLAAFLCAFFSDIRPENFYALQAVFLLIGFEHFSRFLLRKMPFC